MLFTARNSNVTSGTSTSMDMPSGRIVELGTVAIDFDKVIHGYSRGWHDGTIYDGLVDGAAEGVAEVMDHAAAFVHTSRDADQVARWLAAEGFDTTTDQPRGKFWNQRGRLLVTNRKLPALAYLDDRAVRFETWPQALAQLRALGCLR